MTLIITIISVACLSFSAGVSVTAIAIGHNVRANAALTALYAVGVVALTWSVMP